MLNDVIGLISKLSNPLQIVGLALLVLYSIYWGILNKRLPDKIDAIIKQQIIRYIFILGFIPFLIGGGGNILIHPLIDSEIQDGINLLNRKDYHMAANIFRKVLEVDKNNPKAHKELGFTLQAMGEHESAIYHYRRAEEAGITLASHNIGTVYWKMGLYDDALKYFTKYLQTDPDHPPALFGVARVKHVLGDYDEAEKYYLSVINRGSSSEYLKMWSYFNLACLYSLKETEYSTAINYIKKALSFKESGDVNQKTFGPLVDPELINLRNSSEWKQWREQT